MMCNASYPFNSMARSVFNSGDRRIQGLGTDPQQTTRMIGARVSRFLKRHLRLVDSSSDELGSD